MGILFMAGVMAGLSAWTKNEGIMYFLILGGCFAVIAFFASRKQMAVNLIVWIRGAIIPLATVLIFKIQFSTESEFFTGSPLSFLFMGERYWIILIRMFNQLFHWGGWSLPFLIGYIFYMFIGKRVVNEEYEKFQIWYIGLFLILSLAGLFFVYLITPYPLQWQITYSIDRLFFQFFPVFILGMMLLTVSFQELHKQKL